MGRNARLSSDLARQIGLETPVEIHVKQAIGICHVPNPCPQPPQLVRHGVVSDGSACPLDYDSDVGVTFLRYNVEITRLTFINTTRQSMRSVVREIVIVVNTALDPGVVGKICRIPS
ncbi:hypothetical protein Pcinc_002743 [Petrolisthes cinctipes]|uniref:Uncharacterized protein n=1 Tax=Petrolisthes cinctipes TaxID=88211 RepID=A0AAE1GHM0_PETCI|nr:hypothetical protein Pcinc_002743 [Petrolisthes cinctipes]